MNILRFRFLITISLQFITLAAFSFEGLAADVRPFISGSGSYRAIVIEGNIEPGDFDTFLRIARENQGQVSGVFIFSQGGDFYEAMKIGRAMRTLELHSQVPMLSPSGRPVCDGILGIKPNNPTNCTCASAGFFIHIGGISRGGTFLAVHRPYFAKGLFGKLSQAEAKNTFDALQDSARDYMQEMGVPEHVQAEVLGTSSDESLILDENTVKTYFWGELPYRHEWVKNKCSSLSESEKERLENYSIHSRRSINTSDTDLSKTELADLSILQNKKDEERDCGLKVNVQSRTEAYERYFHIKPNDYGNHIFTKWSEAPKYLGRQFYELLSEERFEEEMIVGSSYLNRAATASAPTISLSDSPSKPKIVTWINLISTPNPSPEFIHRAVIALESAWGNHSGGNGATEWLWNKKEFSAKLVHEPKSASGAYLSLVIEKK